MPGSSLRYGRRAALGARAEPSACADTVNAGEAVEMNIDGRPAPHLMGPPALGGCRCAPACLEPRAANTTPGCKDEPPSCSATATTAQLGRLPASRLPRGCGAAADREIGYVETEWDPANPSARYAGRRAAQRHGMPTVAVAQAGSTPIRQVLERRPRSRSCAASVTSRAPTRPRRVRRAWRCALARGFALLAATAFPPICRRPGGTWHEAARWPPISDTQIILNHAGLPADRSAEGLAGWRRSELAAPRTWRSRSPASASGALDRRGR